MTGLYYAPSELETSLGMERRPESVTQASGLNNLGPSAGDIFALQQDIQRGTMALAPPPAPVAPAMLGAPSAPPAYYSPSTGQVFAGGRTFNQRDVQSALAAAQQFTEAAATGMRPPSEVSDWRPMTRGQFDTYLGGLSERRGTGELLVRGGRAAVGGLVGGVGRGIEMLGAPETGRAIGAVGEAITGQDDFDKQRSALIQRNNSTFNNIIDAAIEGVPSVLTSGAAALAGGVAGGLIGGPAGAAAGAATAATLARARTIGAVGGLVATSFPQQLNTFYEAARDARTPDGQPAYDVSNPQTQLEILGGAVGTTLLDVIAPGRVAGSLSRALTDGVQQASQRSVTGWARARSVGGAAGRSGLEEAGTEALQTVMEQALFDPQFRSQLTANDWKALGPYVVEKYGENAVIAAGAGAILGAGFGGAGRFAETGRLPENRPRDMLQGAIGTRAGTEQFGPPAPEQYGPPAPEQFGPFGPEQFGPPAPEQYGPPAPIGTRMGTEQFGPPTPIGTRTGTEQFGPFGAEQFGPPALEQFGPFGPEQFGPPAPQPFGPPAPTPTERQAVQDAQTRARVNASAPRPDMTFDPADPASTRRAMESFGLSVEEVLSLRDPARALAGTPITVRDVNEAAALAGRTRSAGAPAARPLPTVSAPLAQAMQDAGLTMDDVVAVRNRLQAGAVTYEDVRRAARAKGVDLPVRLRVAPETVTPQPAPTAEVAPLAALVESAAAPAAPAAPAPAAPKAAKLKGGRGAKAAPAPAPAPTPAAAPAAANLRRPARAAETGQVAEGRVEQRPDVNEGGAATEAGRGNRALRRPAQTQAPTQEVAAPGGAAPRPLAPAAPARVEAQRPNFDAQIAQAERNGELATLRAELEARIDRESEAGRNTADLSRALARVDERLAAPSAAATAEGVQGPTHPQSRWAAVMEDDGAGYNKLSPEARRKWDSLVANNAPVSREVAQSVQREFPTEDTTRGLAYVARLEKKYAEAEDLEAMTKVLNQLDTLAASANAEVAAAANRALGRETGQNTNQDTGKFSLAGWNTLTGARNADGSAVRPMTSGRARMLVQTFLSKLATRPKVTVVANQDELRRTNPSLYAQANAARSQGDFATAEAAGYSFGDGNVIIFTDRIANEQHLRFVLAHETFGHFGMRGIMPGNRFDALMERIYDGDPQVQAAADAAMEVRGLSKAEAVEEYLSDYAATLATNTVLRVWNAIKNALSSLGVRFGDGATRYFLDQSRRYVREGGQGVTFNAEAVAQRLHAVETGAAGTGRYSPTAAFSQSTRAQVFQAQVGAWPTNLGETLNYIFEKGSDFANTFDDIKAKFFSLANFRALENPGLMEFDGLMGLTNQSTMATKDRLNEYLRPLTDAPEATQARISKIMYAGRSYSIANFDNKMLRGEKLFSVSEDGNIVRNNPEVEKLFKAGLLTKEQIRNGFSYKHSYEGNSGKTETIARKFDGYKDFSDADYELYVRARRAVMDVEMELLQAEYASLAANRRVSYRELGSLMKDAKLDNADKSFISAYVKRYGDLYAKDAEINSAGIQVLNSAAMDNADKFLAAVNAAFIGQGTDRNAEIAKFFDGQPAADAFIEKMMAMKGRRKALPEDMKFDLQNQVKQFYLNTFNLGVRERIARRGVAAGYIPALREGNYQMRLQAFVGDRPVEIKDSHQALLAYSQFDAESGAKGMAQQFNSELKGKTFELLARNAEGEFVPTKVTLRATTGRVLDAVAADPQLNLQDFLYGMSLFGIDANPQVMEKLVTTLTRQENAARNRLEFSQTPGFDDTTGIYALSRHIEARASTIAKTITRQSLRELMNLRLPSSRALWEGNEANVTRLRAEVARLTGKAKVDAQRQLERAEFMYRKTNPADGGDRSMVYYNQAAGTLSYLDGSQFVDESNFGSGPVASRVRAYTSMLQLGASVAQGALNLLSPYTNWMPYMASYNKANAFGGGFGLGQVQAEYHRAFAKIGARGVTNLDMNRADFYDSGAKPTDPTLAKAWKPGVAQSPELQRRYGLTADEARIIAREIREGKLIPAQSNALVATARGYMTNRWMRRFTDAWMSPFNLSEQAARRAAFLAAYRLFRERAIGAGLSETKASDRAREEAIQSIDLTLGEYSVLNRPPAWRNGIQSFLYMYKTYPTTVIQMLARLSRPAQLSTLAGMWLLAGATGLPFAEDLEDLIDTLAQGLGFRQGSIRAEIIRHIEDSFPGMSAVFLRGVVNQIVPADLASRTSAGNFLPGTGMALAGANVTRELQDILGPAAGFVSGLASTARDIVTFPFSSTKSLEDVARSSPITFLRIMGDTSAYLSSGAVVDRRGYVVSPEMDAGTVITRLMGFYPERAATQYDIIRIAQRESDYQKEVVAAYRQAWIKATMRGDTQGAQGILEAVNNWNEGARGTPLEITRFLPNSVRALREAQRGAGERALRAAPRGTQDDIQQLMDALTQ